MEQWKQDLALRIAGYAIGKAISASYKILGRELKERKLRELLACDFAEFDTEESSVLDRLRAATDREIAFFSAACKAGAKTTAYKENRPDVAIALPVVLSEIGVSPPTYPSELGMLEGRGVLYISRGTIPDPETLGHITVHLQRQDVEYVRSLVEALG